MREVGRAPRKDHQKAPHVRQDYVMHLKLQTEKTNLQI